MTAKSLRFLLPDGLTDGDGVRHRDVRLRPLTGKAEEQLARFAELEAEMGDRMWGPRGGRGKGRGRMHGPQPGHMGGPGGWGWGPGPMPGHSGPRCDVMGCPPPQGPGPARDAFARLDLSDEQKAELKELRAEHREEMEKLRSKHLEKMESVLTKEQRQELEELKDDVFYGRSKAGPQGRRCHPKGP